MRIRQGTVSVGLLGAFAWAALAGCGGEGDALRDATQQSAGDPADGATSSQSDTEALRGIPGGDGLALVVEEDWVSAETNGIGVQGAFFTYGDGSGRTRIVGSPSSSGGYCVSGSAAEVLGGDFGGTWGAVAALNLNQLEGEETARPYDADAHRVVGFRFDIVGNTGGALRFVVKQFMIHDGFCINNVPDCNEGCSAEYRIDELTQNCWEPGGVTPLTSQLSAVEWQITTKEGEATDFDYCIENVAAVLQEPPNDTPVSY